MAAIFPIIFFPCFIAFMIFVIVIAQKQMRRVDVGGRSYPTAEEFVASFAPELGLWGTASGAGPGPVAAHFSGTLANGPCAQVSYSAQGGKQPAYLAHLAVASEATPSLVVTRGDGLGRILARLGWKTEVLSGESSFDRRFFVESKDPRAKKALASDELRYELEGVFTISGVERLEVTERSVVLSARADLLLLDAYGVLLARLARIARAFTRGAITIRLLGGERHENARCGFCHADLSEDDTRVVACERCSTIVHEECWAELARCPVAGCTGGAPRRPVRVAA